MKNFILSLSVMFCFFSSAVMAQTSVIEEEMSMSQGLKNGFYVDLEGFKADDLADSWKEYLKDMKIKKTKYNRKKKEYFSDNATIEAMSNNTVDIYATFTEMKTGVRLAVWFDLGGAYLNTDQHADASVIGRQIVYEFAIKVQKERAQKAIDVEVAAMKKLEKTLDGVTKDQATYNKEIEKLRKQIAKLEEKIEQAKTKQSETQQAIGTQKERLDKAKAAFDAIQ